MSDSRHKATATATAERSQASFGEILGDVTRDLSTLVRQEAQLAKAELREEAKAVGDLVGDVTRDVSTLVRQEVQLAKTELRQEAKTAGKVGGMFGVAGLAAVLTLIFLSAAVWWGLIYVVAPVWASLIVAGIWAVIGGAAAVLGRKQMQQLQALPQTREKARDIPNAVRGR